MLIRDEFLKSLANYESDGQKRNLFWTEIDTAYSDSNRHYHTLRHLESLLIELLPFKHKFANWDVTVFAIVYHDVIYSVLKNDNEEKSAEFARKKLNDLLFPEKLIDRCVSFILATKKHESEDKEINLFTDADLSILASTLDQYKTYASQIRKEYHIYPDFMYNAGRKKVLHHFLEKPRIFRSSEFSNYEKQARLNLSEELTTLG